jgi:hypothetical protein
MRHRNDLKLTWTTGALMGGILIVWIFINPITEWLMSLPAWGTMGILGGAVLVALVGCMRSTR